MDWSVAEEALAGCESALILGRGAGYPIACEAALKLKETSYVFAEAFSAAEVWHGPAALITPERPVILFAPSDEASVGALATAEKARALGARVFVVSRDPSRNCLLVPDASNSTVEAITMIARFYALAERVSSKRGVDVCLPRALQKVTVTAQWRTGRSRKNSEIEADGSDQRRSVFRRKPRKRPRSQQACGDRDPAAARATQGRADVARITGLSVQTSNIAEELICFSLLLESPVSTGLRGKPPKLLTINPDGAYSIGLQLDHNWLIGVLLDLTGVRRGEIMVQGASAPLRLPYLPHLRKRRASSSLMPMFGLSRSAGSASSCRGLSKGTRSEVTVRPCCPVGPTRRSPTVSPSG